jgi:hypothetical protein
MESGEFDMVVQNVSDFANDPTAQFNTLLSKQASPIAYSRHSDNELDELFDRHSQVVDPHARLELVGAFERHSLTMACNIAVLPARRRQQ